MGKPKNSKPSEKANKNVLPTPEEHKARKDASKASKKRRPSGLGKTQGTLLNELVSRSYRTAQQNAAADKSAQHVAASTRIARTSRTPV